MNSSGRSRPSSIFWKAELTLRSRPLSNGLHTAAVHHVSWSKTTQLITGDVKNQIDRIWDAFWSGGISNSLEVIEQITYLLFIRRLDDLHTLEDTKSRTLKTPMERRLFPEGRDDKWRPYEDCRWSRFKHFAAAEMYTVVAEHVFPFLRQLNGSDTAYGRHMKDARFTIPTPALLARVVDMLEQVPMEDRDTKGDIYE